MGDLGCACTFKIMLLLVLSQYKHPVALASRTIFSCKEFLSKSIVGEVNVVHFAWSFQHLGFIWCTAWLYATDVGRTHQTKNLFAYALTAKCVALYWLVDSPKNLC